MNPSEDPGAGEAEWQAIQKLLARFGKVGWLDTATISEDLAHLEFTEQGLKMLAIVRALDARLGGLTVPEMSALFAVAILTEEPPDASAGDGAK